MTLLLALLTHRYAILASDRRVTCVSKHYENATKQILIDNRMAIAYCGVADLQRSWENPQYNPESDTYHRPDYFLFRELPVTLDPIEGFSKFPDILNKRWTYGIDYPLCYVSVFFAATPELPDIPRFLPAICTVGNFLSDDLQQIGIRHEFRTGLRILNPSLPFTFRIFGHKHHPEVIHATYRRLAKHIHDPHMTVREILRSFETHLANDNSNQNVVISYIPHPDLSSPMLSYSTDFRSDPSFVFYNNGTPSHSIDQVLIRVGGNNLDLKDVSFEHLPVRLIEMRRGPRPRRYADDA